MGMELNCELHLAIERPAHPPSETAARGLTNDFSISEDAILIRSTSAPDSPLIIGHFSKRPPHSCS